MNRLVKLFIKGCDALEFTRPLRSLVLILVTGLALASCGGGDSNSDDGLLTTNPNPVEPLPPGPAPTNSPQPTQIPLPADPSPTPVPTAVPEPSNFRILQSDITDGALNLSWSDANADSYRILYWQGDDAPNERITSNLDLSIPAPPEGNYTVIVEAYDALGNSIFSAPDFVEVIR